MEDIDRNAVPSVSPTLIQTLAKRLAEEAGAELASLLPLIINDMVLERNALGYERFVPKTVRIPMTVELRSSCSGRVCFGESTWDVRAKRRNPGFPAIDVDLGQPELEFREPESPQEPADEEPGLSTILWDRLAEAGRILKWPVFRPYMGNNPAPETYLTVLNPKGTQWQDHCLGTEEKVCEAIEYPANALEIQVNGGPGGIFGMLSEDSVRQIVKDSPLFPMDITDLAINHYDWDPETERPYISSSCERPQEESISETWLRIFKAGDAVPIKYPWPPPDVR